MDKVVIDLYNSNPILAFIMAFIVCMAFVIAYLVWMRIKQPQVISQDVCDKCSYKVIAGSAANHINTAVDMLKEQKVTISNMELKMDAHTLLIKEITETQSKTTILLNEILLRIKLQKGEN